ncbi:MAG: hypothetical protein Unbinned6805contig1000_46 [Prokaryotic dsDNA virus sp.]|nr:MAG: hypothetical protein Unbinned6805contig1000_46 [Prokaryotic dsDNA virus sp.]|tara:strand:+ start:2307 stop:3110 length:804 start_codon:yes stop_codon:yes gene_type:complete
MKSTLLKLAQDISSSMDGDEFGSISDTFESEQIVTVLRTVYRDIVSNRNWPHLKKSVTLESYGDLALPTHVRIKENTTELVLLNYNKQKADSSRLEYIPLRWQDNDVFLRRLNGNNSDSESFDIIQDPTGIQLIIRNDAPPTYYTSFDDETIVCDSYDKAVDSTLVGSKFQAVAYLAPNDWRDEDDFVVDLPDEAFSAYYNEAKSLAFIELRQQGHALAAQQANRQQRWLARKAWRVEGGVKYPDYGRKKRRARDISDHWRRQRGQE